MLSANLQMMPGGMTPSGWDLGSMWLTWIVVLLAVVLVVVLVTFLLRRDDPRPATAYYADLSRSQSTQTIGVGGPKTPANPPQTAILGEVLKSLAPTLIDDEHKVMDELVKAGGEVLQSDLPRLTNFSKATISKAIHGLEIRGIVVREKHKWTYWCKVNPRLVERTVQEQPELQESRAVNA